MPREIEAKYMSIVPESLRVRLAEAGYTCVRPWSRMKRYTFLLTELNPDPEKWARVRDEGDKVVMTFKKVHDKQDIHGTEEVEFTVNDFDAAVTFMKKLGFDAWTFQENDRETWVKESVEVTLNQWPALPPFAEVEGPTEAAVQEASHALGFDYTTAVFGGVGRLYGLQTLYTGNDGMDIGKIRELTFARESWIAQGPATTLSTNL